MADWLDDHGEPNRAEFIRVQVGLARPPFLSRESYKLSNRESLVVPEAPEGVPHHWGPVYRRGFLYKVKMSFQEFRANARQLFSRHPITKVEVTDKVLTNRDGEWGFGSYEDK
jgi:hypothetical protein